MEAEGNEAGPAPYDLDSYIASYSGHTKVDRLCYIAERCRGQPLELEALKLAHDELRKSENSLRYLDVIQRIEGRLGPEYMLDNKWLESIERRSTNRQERLEQELNGVKTNLIKESIRMGQNDLGDVFYERGDLQNAFKAYVRSRDYCTTSKHIINMCLSVVRVAVEMANWMHVQNYVAKAEQTPDVGAEPIVTAKIKAAMGLALLHTKKYKQAARKLVEVNAELGTNYSDVMAPQDVAIYGGLSALATFDRAELHSRVIANIGFKEFLELVPELRDLIRDFYDSRYAACLRALDTLTATLRLDMHMGEHIAGLYAQIRQRAVTQYVAPFTSVNMHTMAQAFNTSVGDLEREVAGLIMDGKVQARIDSHNKVLYARHADTRGQTFQQVLTAGEAYLRDTKAMLLRASLIQHDFVQRPKGAAAGWGRDGPGGGGPGGGGGGPSGRGPRGGGGPSGEGPSDGHREHRGFDREHRGGVYERAMFRELL